MSCRSIAQEFLLGEAEDLAEVVAVDESVTVPAGTYAHCLKTAETTPAEPDHLENKFYAPGVGLLQTTNPATGEVTALIQIKTE